MVVVHKRTIFFDNDVVYKLAAYGLLDQACEILGVEPSQVRVLDSCLHRIRKLTGEKRAAYEARLTPEGLAAAIAFAEHAVRTFASDDGVWALLEDGADDGMDAGEIVLLAGCMAARPVYLASGDKRWPPVVATGAAYAPLCEAMQGCVWCLEALVLALIERFGYETVFAAIHRALALDTSLRVAFMEKDEARTIGYLTREVVRLAGLYGGMMREAPSASSSPEAQAAPPQPET